MSPSLFILIPTSRTTGRRKILFPLPCPPYRKSGRSNSEFLAEAETILATYGIIAKPKRVNRDAPTEHRPARNDPSKQAYLDAAFTNECKRCADASKGERNNVLNISALKLGHFVGGGWLHYGRVAKALEDAAETNGHVRDDGIASVRATIKSGLDAGVREPKDPPERISSLTGGFAQAVRDTHDQPPDWPTNGAQSEPVEPDPLDGLVEKATADPGAPFAPEVLERLAVLKKEDHAAFEALRARLKRAGCRVTALDEALDEPLTEEQFAAEITRLAALSPIEYHRQSRDAAKRLGIDRPDPDQVGEGAPA